MNYRYFPETHFHIFFLELHPRARWTEAWRKQFSRPGAGGRGEAEAETTPPVSPCNLTIPNPPSPIPNYLQYRAEHNTQVEALSLRQEEPISSSPAYLAVPVIKSLVPQESPLDYHVPRGHRRSTIDHESQDNGSSHRVLEQEYHVHYRSTANHDSQENNSNQRFLQNHVPRLNHRSPIDHDSQDNQRLLEKDYHVPRVHHRRTTSHDSQDNDISQHILAKDYHVSRMHHSSTPDHESQDSQRLQEYKMAMPEPMSFRSSSLPDSQDDSRSFDMQHPGSACESDSNTNSLDGRGDKTSRREVTSIPSPNVRLALIRQRVSILLQYNKNILKPTRKNIFFSSVFNFNNDFKCWYFFYLTF